MPMEAHASGHLLIEAPAVDGLWTVVRLSARPIDETPPVRQSELAIKHSPLDRQALHSTFLI